MVGYYCFMLLLFTLSLSFSSSSSSADLIQQTCKSTKYYDLCVSSLKSDASSPSADGKGLALIMARVGVANATATSAYLSSWRPANNTSMRKPIKECADRYALASEALRSSVQDLSSEMYDYAYMHVMAAADYPNGCRNAFKRAPGLLYPPEIALREDALKRICDVALGIIDALAF